jgi:hypothetical protein
MANFFSLGSQFLAASAMTTALSADKRILNKPIYKSVVCKNSIEMTAIELS